MKLILIRHAEPDYPNNCLTDYGHQQAALLGQKLKSARFDEIYLSPLERAQLTADYITPWHNCKKVTLPWIEELNGNYRDELWSWDLHACELHQQEIDWSQSNWNKYVPYGEHMQPLADELYSNFDRFMSEQGCQRYGKLYRLLPHYKSKSVVLICHAGVIKTLLSYLLHLPLPLVYAHFDLSPSSVTELVTVEKDGYAAWRMKIINNMSHIPISHDVLS